MMGVKFGYIGTHENHTPEELLEQAILAEKHGFDTLWNSDHFHPWGHTGASGGFAWVWMAAAAERTKKAPIGTAVTAPGYRYHPALIAQAFATLGRLYEGRMILGLGVGESLNEYPLGYDWPPVKERVERFEECVKIIRLLWNEEFVDFKGKYYQLRKTNLYTKPRKPVLLYISSQGPRVSAIAGKYADGYIYSVNADEFSKGIKIFQEVCWPAVEKGAREAGRDPSTIDRVGSLFVSYDEDYQKAVNGCMFWKGALASGGALTKQILYDPREVEAAGEGVSWEQIAKHFIVSTRAEDHISKLDETVQAGFNHILVTSMSPDVKKFFKFYANKVLPYFREKYPNKE